MVQSSGHLATERPLKIMFEYWTPTGHIFAIVISFLYANYVAKGKILSKKGLLNFFGSAVFCYLAMGLWG